VGSYLGVVSSDLRLRDASCVEYDFSGEFSEFGKMGEVEVGKFSKKLLGVSVISDCSLELVIKRANKCFPAGFADSDVPLFISFVPANPFVD